MNYYTPPPSGNWNGAMPFSQNNGGSAGAQPVQQNSQYSQPPHHQQQQQNMPNPMLMMMTMMQQMQNVPPPAPRLPLSSPGMEPHKPSIPMDEHKLAQVLFQQTSNGVSYKAAIETMHGADGYAAYAWKDFYLERKQRVDYLIDEIKSRASRPSAQPDSHVENVKREHSASVSVGPKEASVQASQRKSKDSSIPTKPLKNKGKVKSLPKEDLSISTSRRKTFNSLSVTPGDNLLALVPPGVAIDPHTGLPAAPEECPTAPAPTSFVAKGHRGRGNAYTEEDVVFFYQLVAWELANNPDATKGSICEVLSELAPHHSTLSWRTFWQRHEDVADKMIMLSELDDIDREERIRTWKNEGTTRVATTSGRSTKKVSYAESSSDEEDEEEAEAEKSESDSLESLTSDDADGEVEDEDEDEDAIGSTDDDEQMGEAGTPFTQVEMRVLAKYIASVPGWYKGPRDWSGFVDKHTQRTAASWREYYRRKQKEVDEAARKYIKRAKRLAESNSIHQQRGRPSWASSNSGKPPSAENATHKRKYAEQSGNGSKRAKSDDTD